jgi:hypothetical protein
MKRIGHNAIQFRELHPYVFHKGYSVPKGPNGRYQLTFNAPDGTSQIGIPGHTYLLM